MKNYFPEIGPRIVTSDQAIEEMTKPHASERAEDSLAKDFIICNHCNNVTLRIKLSEKTGVYERGGQSPHSIRRLHLLESREGLRYYDTKVTH